jgi:phosphoglycolate phosphatase
VSDLVIFDLDGTLIDTAQDLTTAANRTLAGFGGEPCTVAEIVAAVGDGVGALVDRVLPAGNVDPETALRIFREHYADCLLDTTRPFDGIEELLDSLGEQRVALATNKPLRYTHMILEGLGWMTRFDPVMGGDSLPRKKPDPMVIHRICERHGVDPSRALMIGDSPQDIAAGRSAGAKTCGVTWGFRGAELLREAGADWIAEEPAELLAIIQAPS